MPIPNGTRTSERSVMADVKTPVKKHKEQDVETVDVQAVNSAEQRQLYQSRIPIYPKLVHGTFRNIKWIMLFMTLGVYYLLPFVRWDHGEGAPNQAVLADFAGRRFYFFFIEIWPQEVYYITGLLILSALALFFATALFGRVWCGYACPQTIWTDLFVAVERMIEGDRNARIKLHKLPLSKRLGKFLLKHAVWLFIAFVTGGAFVFYFHDAPTILKTFFVGKAPGSAYLFTGILTFTTYSLAGLMREQVCTYMCPWPRIQAALTDENTLEVTYKKYRGEPRGKHKKNESWEGRGDCVDCKQCVAVCPMGIDIRDGDQLECINCALCIDACDAVMEKVGRPKGLIAYDTEVNRQRHEAGEKPKFSFIRARTVFYGLMLAIVGALMLFGLTTRSTLDLNVLRDRAPTYVKLSDGGIRNGYTVKIINKGSDERTFNVSLKGLQDYSMKVIGIDNVTTSVDVKVKPDELRQIKLYITAPRAIASGLKASTPVTFVVREVNPPKGKPEVKNNKSVFLAGRT